MVREFRDTLDAISLAVAVFVGFFVTLKVEGLLNPVLIEQRGKVAVGGEYLFYALILGAVIFGAFQGLTWFMHYCRED